MSADSTVPALPRAPLVDPVREELLRVALPERVLPERALAERELAARALAARELLPPRALFLAVDAVFFFAEPALAVLPDPALVVAVRVPPEDAVDAREPAPALEAMHTC